MKKWLGLDPALFSVVLIMISMLGITSNINWGGNNWKTVLESDAKGYYAYLPAVFIYNDPNFGFFDEIEKNIYFDERDSEISVTTYIPNDSRVSNLKKTQKLYNYVTKNQVSNIILSPELFLTSFKISSQIEHANHYFIRRLIKLKPNTAFFAGAEIIDDDSRRFNAMMVINEKGNFYRIKRKYVPIREHVPKYLKFAFGESFYSRCENDDQRIISKLYGIFPVLCYESIFSTYIVKNVEDNNLIFLSTSEEFMNNSYFGKKQYLDIVRLRAIETNRNVIKCSNEGYSCVINEKGAITTRITEEYQNVIAYKIENHSIYQKLIKSP